MSDTCNVIKDCNNKIEQGENNALFCVCARSYLGGKKSFSITFIVNCQSLIASVKPACREIMVVVFKVCNEVLKQLYRR